MDYVKSTFLHCCSSKFFTVLCVSRICEKMDCKKVGAWKIKSL